MSFHDNYTLNGPLMSQSVSLELLTKCRNDGLMPAAITITWSRHVIPLKRGGAATLDQPSLRAKLAHLIVGTPHPMFCVSRPWPEFGWVIRIQNAPDDFVPGTVPLRQKNAGGEVPLIFLYQVQCP